MTLFYKGRTKKDIIEGIAYCENTLKNEMENWERKEFEAVLEDYKIGLASIKERELILQA